MGKCLCGKLTAAADLEREERRSAVRQKRLDNNGGLSFNELRADKSGGAPLLEAQSAECDGQCPADARCKFHAELQQRSVFISTPDAFIDFNPGGEELDIIA
eukprot:1157342-Heterocapsa_arctica.AAC.1